jgi:phytoene dehydrogenase-like protein
MGVMRLIAEAVICPASAPIQSVEKHLLRIFGNSPFYSSVVAPFLEGVLLRDLADLEGANNEQEKNLLSSSPASVLHNLLPYFIFGKALLFDGGASALPRFLSGSLPKESVRLGSYCSKIEMTHERLSPADPYRVTIQEGSSSYVVTARRVVVASTLPTVLPLLETISAPTESSGGLPLHKLPPYNRTSHTYYLSSDTPPYSEPLLLLNGGPQGIVNHVAVLTNVQPSYAPHGKHLIAVCTRRAASFEEVISECYQLFAGVDSAQRYPSAPLSLARKLAPVAERVIKSSLPEFTLAPAEAGFIRHLGVYLAGDATTYGSQNGALLAGRRVAESILSES